MFASHWPRARKEGFIRSYRPTSNKRLILRFRTMPFQVLSCLARAWDCFYNWTLGLMGFYEQELDIIETRGS